MVSQLAFKSLKLDRWHWFTQFLPVVFAKVISVLQKFVTKDLSFCSCSLYYCRLLSVVFVGFFFFFLTIAL